MTEQETQKAFDTCKQLKTNIKLIREKQVENIPLLEEIFLHEWYKVDMGDEEASWTSFLGQPEVTIPRSHVQNWLVIKRNLSDAFGIPLEEISDVKISKLYLIALHAASRDEAEDLISKARTLLPGEWRDIENKLKGKHESNDGHAHDFKHLLQCKVCGLKETQNGQ